MDEATRQEAIDRLRQQELKLLETEEIGRYALSEISFFARDVSNGEEEIRENVERLYGRLSDEQKASYLGMRPLRQSHPGTRRAEPGFPAGTCRGQHQPGQGKHLETGVETAWNLLERLERPERHGRQLPFLWVQGDSRFRARFAGRNHPADKSRICQGLAAGHGGRSAEIDLFAFPAENV